MAKQTKKADGYQAPKIRLTASDITSASLPILEYDGWAVVEFAHYDKMPNKAAGFPDVVAFRDGVTWLIEVKGYGDRLRDSQMEFYWKLRPHLGSTLRYMIAETPEDVLLVLSDDRITIIPDKFFEKMEVYHKTNF